MPRGIAPGTPTPAPVVQSATLDGKPATETHFAINPSKSGSAAPVAPIETPKNVQWGESKVVVQAKENAEVGQTRKAELTYYGNVQDGDTVKLKRKDGPLTGSDVVCRLRASDAPETAKPWKNDPGQPGGEEAKAYLQKLLAKGEITVTVTQPQMVDTGVKKTGANDYGRALCKITVEGKDVDQSMVQAGMSWLFRKYNPRGNGIPEAPEYAKDEKAAQDNKLGIWSQPAIDPALHRRLYK